MPYGDRSGPAGAGPMTGRAAGLCAGYDVPGYRNPAYGGGFGRGFGRGFGMGFGRGRGFRGGRGGHGWRNTYWATGQPGWARFGWYGTAPMAAPDPDAEKQFLQEEAGYLRTQLDGIKKRLDSLTKQQAKTDAG